MLGSLFIDIAQSLAYKVCVEGIQVNLYTHFSICSMTKFDRFVFQAAR